ncbi:MAG: prolipoprotein diacylglyceryl transferase [Oscillospiraceae bacterium]|nr:prolipoprotein diacylglyceryl transferase [Oscillospiraceae bacterium]
MTTVYFKALEKGFDVQTTFLRFNFFGHDVRIQWYGVLIAFGFTLAVLFGGRMAYKWKMNLDKMIDVLIGGTVLGVIGARLYFVLFHWDLYKENPMDVFKIWEGGLAIYGGLIGGLIGAAIVCKVRDLSFLKLLDLCGMSFLIGQGIGRWGNFTNQEAFGTNTNLPWGMWSQTIANDINSRAFELAAHGITVDGGSITDKAYVHPTFLYESIWCLAAFAVLYWICSKHRKFDGQIMLCYGILYGAERAVVEGLRLDSLYIGSTNIRISQLLSAILVVVCGALLTALLIKHKDDPVLPADLRHYFVTEEEEEVADTVEDAAMQPEDAAMLPDTPTEDTEA